jgi:hypothetical protein
MERIIGARGLWQAKTEFRVSFRYLKVWALGSGLLGRLLKGLAQRDGLSCSLIKRCEKNTCYKFFPVWQSIRGQRYFVLLYVLFLF